eukprot:2013170-Alexandrium_andersonii.AAC.1
MVTVRTPAAHATAVPDPEHHDSQLSKCHISPDELPVRGCDERRGLKVVRTADAMVGLPDIGESGFTLRNADDQLLAVQ